MYSDSSTDYNYFLWKRGRASTYQRHLLELDSFLKWALIRVKLYARAAPHLGEVLSKQTMFVGEEAEWFVWFHGS